MAITRLNNSQLTGTDPTGFVNAEQHITLANTYTLTSSTSIQKLFGTPTNGTFTLAAGTYRFQCSFDISAMSATSGTFSFAFGTSGTLDSVKYRASAVKSTIATPTTPFFTTSITTLGTPLMTAGTGTVGHALIDGIIRFSTAATLTPSIQLSVAAAAVIGINSYFRLWYIGSATVASFGNVT